MRNRAAGMGAGVRLLVLGLGLLFAPTAPAEHSEAEVKAAFVYNFAKFVEWPSASFASNGTLQVCLLGPDALEGQLELLAGREAQGREIAIRSLASAKDWSGCHILFLGQSNDSQRRQSLMTLGNAAVLTISDSPDFARKGGMIGLWVKDQRVQFSVNLGLTQQAGLKLSPRMLQLAHLVQEARP